MKGFALLTTLGFLAACGDSSAPAPTMAGTWHVTTGSIAGILAPTAFDVVVRAVGKDSFAVTFPTVTWTPNGTDFVTYNGVAGLTLFTDTSQYGFWKAPSTPTQRCQWVGVRGGKNAGRDTLLLAIVEVANSDTMPGGYCQTVTSGSATVTKQ